MSIDDGPAYRQPHSCSIGLGGVESVEDALQLRPIDARSGIAHGHENACVVLLSADQQLPWTRLNRAHCFNRVEDQVQQDLLKLNPISVDGGRPLREASLDRDSVLDDCASRQSNNLVDCLTEIKTLLLRRLSLSETQSGWHVRPNHAMLLSYERSLPHGLVGAGLIVPVAGFVGS